MTVAEGNPGKPETVEATDHEPLAPDDEQIQQALLAMNLVADAGQQMLESSPSVSEVINRLRRVLPAAGLEGCALDANLSMLVLSYAPYANAVPITMVREVEIGDPRLERLSGTSALLDELQDGTITVEQAAKRLKALYSGGVRRLLARVATVVSVLGWVLFLGGLDLLTILVALAATALTFPLDSLVRRLRLPSLTETFFDAVIVAATANLVAAAGASILIGPAVVGALFIYLPGRALVSSVIDGLNNAPMSSLSRGLEALVTAGFLALGMLVGSRIGIGAGLGIDYRPDVSSTPLILSMAGVILGVLGIAVAWSIPPRQLVPTLAMSVVAWLVVALPDLRGEGSGWWAYAVGATLLGVAGVVVGAIQRSPATAYTGVAILPLVPGFALYAGMLAWAQGDTALAASTLGGASVIAIAIAVGVAIGVALGRNTVSVSRWVRRRPKRSAGPSR